MKRDCSSTRYLNLGVAKFLRPKCFNTHPGSMDLREVLVAPMCCCVLGTTYYGR